MRRLILIAITSTVLGTNLLSAKTDFSQNIKYADDLLCKITHTGNKNKSGDFDMTKLNDMDEFLRVFVISENGKVLTNGTLVAKYDSARKNQVMRYKTAKGGTIEFSPVEMEKGYNDLAYDIHWYLKDGKSKGFGTCITRTDPCLSN